MIVEPLLPPPRVTTAATTPDKQAKRFVLIVCFDCLNEPISLQGTTLTEQNRFSLSGSESQLSGLTS